MKDNKVSNFLNWFLVQFDMTAYRLGRELDFSKANIYRQLEGKCNDIFITQVCKMRKKSKMSWGKFGKVLDEHFLE